MKSFYLIECFVIIFHTNVFSSHLPEDKRDDGVELIREKRDNIIDKILKSIPFFHMTSPQNVLEEEQIDQLDDYDDDDSDEEQPYLTSTSMPLHPSTTVGLRTLPSYVAMGANETTKMNSTPITLSATILQSPTVYSSQSSYSVSMSKDSIITSPSSDVNVPTNSMTQTSVEPRTIMTTNSISDIIDTFMTTTYDARNDTISNISLYTYPSSSSTISTMHASVVMPTTVSKMASTPSVNKDDSEPVIKMMIMSGESPMRVQGYGGRFPDERGFGDNIVTQQVGEDVDVKNIRFMYASVLVPVMSGLVGALLITFGILIFKCIKRKKLKRIRYYGAKPGSGLYRLDQIGLLSDMSSDED